MEDWGPLVSAVTHVWPKAGEFLRGTELERFEARALVALRALDAARDTSGEGFELAENEAIHAAAREVAAVFEAHEPLGDLLAAEFDALLERQERFGPAPPPPDWVPWQRALLVPVLYATDRAAAPGQSGFSSERGPLAYGELRVSIPDDHRMGAAEKPRLWRLRFRDDPARVATLGTVTTSTAHEFAQLARTRFAKVEDGQALVFIHGYNVTFPDAAIRAAQIAYDLNFTGVPILYSWPSKGAVRGYVADENSVSRSVPYFQDFLRHVLTETGVSEVHIVAHSMGNRLLTEALADLDTTTLPEGSGRVGQVIFAAPDVDAESFRQRLPRIVRQAKGCTLYASSADRALAVSSSLAAAPRAGQSGAGIIVAPGLDTIDATALDTGLMSHSYVGDHRSVLADVHGLLRRSLPPSQRFGLVSVPHTDGSYWSFQPQK
ncbi:alpha/beta hydrolase [Streptomyces parvus]|uniref:alpha/beta hydrolase n=1 Tax=Streptomyces griseus TaxID=1911 RepID=UPI00067B8C20|nr:alpha/beta hydrolase [Streptomyces griseus]